MTELAQHLILTVAGQYAVTHTSSGAVGDGDEDRGAAARVTDQLYTEKEVADMLAVSVRTVRRLKRSGQLGYFMVGGSTRYSEREIVRYLKSRERRAKAA